MIYNIHILVLLCLLVLLVPLLLLLHMQVLYTVELLIVVVTSVSLLRCFLSYLPNKVYLVLMGALTAVYLYVLRQANF
jgi:hypothetical protein